jgi:hypothetical protein
MGTILVRRPASAETALGYRGGMSRRQWFGPRRFGWGWSPVTWQGWVVVAVYVALLIAVAALTSTATTLVVAGTATVLLFGVMVLTGGRPGHRS